MQVAAGDYHNIGLREDGTAIAWGLERIRRNNATSLLVRPLCTMAAGGSHNIGLRKDGTAIAWGCN